MRGPFDESQPEPARQRRDPELTLSWGMLLAIFFGLVLICGLCFGLGYTVGHRSPQQPVAVVQPADNAPPTQQASASAAKPSANKQTPAASVAPDAGDGQAGDPSAGAPADTQAAASSSQAVAASGASAGSSSNNSPQMASPQVPPAQVRPVVPAVTNPQPVTGFTPGVRVQPALPQPVASYMVQIAAVSHTEDAAVLVTALRKRGYTVTAQRKPEDGMIHVWIGPFSTRDEANRWKVKLLDDGYNAVVQP